MVVEGRRRRAHLGLGCMVVEGRRRLACAVRRIGRMLRVREERRMALRREELHKTLQREGLRRVQQLEVRASFRSIPMLDHSPREEHCILRKVPEAERHKKPERHTIAAARRMIVEEELRREMPEVHRMLPEAEERRILFEGEVRRSCSRAERRPRLAERRNLLAREDWCTEHSRKVVDNTTWWRCSEDGLGRQRRRKSRSSNI
jgi:hypothetical protein